MELNLTSFNLLGVRVLSYTEKHLVEWTALLMNLLRLRREVYTQTR